MTQKNPRISNMIDNILGAASAVALGDEVFDHIAEAVADMNSQDRTATSMTAMSVALATLAKCVSADAVNKHLDTPREVIRLIAEHAMQAFPEKAPKAEELPTVKRDLPRGKSPWGL